MARLSDLIDVHLKETEAILAQSNLILQKLSHGQSGELKSAGNIVENYIRSFIKQISPDIINVTSGYIVNPESFKSDKNLSQHDIILSNKMTPPLFSIINNEIEIIPIESMVGIIEIKRKLTKDSINNAQKHIKDTYENVIKQYRNKETAIDSMSLTSKPGSSSPLFGIIGLIADVTEEEIREVIDPNVIDFVWAFNHNEAYVIGDDRGIVRGNVTRLGISSPRLLKIEDDNAIVFSKLKGILSYWISNLSSPWMKSEAINGYYINIWDK